MPEPIYSKRYPKEGKSGRGKQEKELEALSREEREFPRREFRRALIFGKVVEVTSRNECDVDIFEGSETLLVKIYFDLPCSIFELDWMLGLAEFISINTANDGHDAVLTIFYDLEA